MTNILVALCPSQEVAQEKYDKTVAPRLADEQRLSAMEEQAIVKKRAAAQEAADVRAVERQASKIISIANVRTSIRG